MVKQDQVTGQLDGAMSGVVRTSKQVDFINQVSPDLLCQGTLVEEMYGSFRGKTTVGACWVNWGLSGLIPGSACFLDVGP